MGIIPRTPIPSLFHSKKFIFLFLLILNLGIIFEVVMVLKILSQHALTQKAGDVDTEVNHTAQLITDKCKSSGEVCYALAFGDTTKSHSLPFVFSVLTRTQELDPSTRGCHLIAHSIAAYETEKNPSDWLALLRKMDQNICSGGLLHGVIEAHSQVDASFVLNGDLVNKICDYVAETKGDGGALNCAHIMGHITLAQKKGNIFSSVRVCNEADKKLQYECFSGVFMENETRDNLEAHNVAKKIPWDDQTTKVQEDICRSYKGEAAKSCWREIVHMYTFTSNNDPKKVYILCQRAAIADATNDCYFHGIGVMGSTSTWNPENNKYVCLPFVKDKSNYQSCTEWFVNSMMASSVQFAPQAVQFCKDIDELYKNNCMQHVADLVKKRSKGSAQQSLCNELPSQYAKQCTGD